MNTREIYFKSLISTDLPMGVIHYIYKDNNSVIQIGKNICVEFRTEDSIVNKYVSKMEEIEKTDGFMFWNNSPEGEDFFFENWNYISKSLFKNI